MINIDLKHTHCKWSVIYWTISQYSNYRDEQFLSSTNKSITRLLLSILKHLKHMQRTEPTVSDWTEGC